MISAPREMRCKLRSIASIPKKTMARTRGMEIATTRPALRPRLRKLTTSTITIASRRALVKPPIASRTTSGWSETSLSSMPTGKSLHQALGHLVQTFAEGEVVAPGAHVDADADFRFAVDAKHLGGRVAVAVLDLGDVVSAYRSARRPRG